jgi:tripartite-type tricarboxylate transporter receptor subunit TctC
MPIFFRIALMVVLAALAAAQPAMAQTWPSRPVKFIISQPPGAGPDIMARFLGERLSKIWGQSVVVENRPGGANLPGTVAAKNAPADGYNFFMATGGILLNVYTFKTLPYDPDKDFVPVAFIGKAPFVLSVNPSVPANTLSELVAYLKANPGKVSFASEGLKSLGGMMGEYLMVLTGARFTHVPYNGAAAGIQDTVVGRTQMTFQSATASTPFIKSGKLKAIAVTSSRPVPGIESVPTLKTLYPDFEYVGWYMLYAPAGAPAEIVQRVNRDVDRVLKEPEVAQKLFELGPVVEGVGTSESLRQFHKEEHERWARLVKATGIQPE